MRMTALLLVIFPLSVNAECFTVENFKGVSALSFDGYSISDDSISSKFEIEINMPNATIRPDTGTACVAMSSQIAICSGGVDGQVTTVELFSIDTRQNKAIYVQVRNGLEAVLMSDLNGGKVFIGEVTGKCAVN